MSVTLTALLVAGPPLAPAWPGDGVRTPRIELGMRLVIRPDARVNATMGREPADDQWRVQEGARLSLRGWWGPAKMVIQLQDVRAWGTENSTLSLDTRTGLHQGFLELGARRGGEFMVRAGRQEIVLWSGRLLGNAPWQPANRAFDAIRSRFQRGRFHVDAAALLLAAPGTFVQSTDAAGATITGRTSGDQVYVLETGVEANPGLAIDVAGLARRLGPNSASPTQDRVFAGPGIHIHGAPRKGLDYAAEAWLQVGRDGGRRHVAWMSAATIGYTVDSALRPGLRVTHEVASGDACRRPAGAGCGASTRADFDQLFGTRHGYRGYADMLALIGAGDMNGRLSLNPDPSVTISIDYHWLYLYHPNGRWLDASGQPVGVGWDLENERRGVANEVDMLVAWRPFRFLDVRPGYSLVFPTRAGARIAGPHVQHFAYLWLIAEF